MQAVFIYHHIFGKGAVGRHAQYLIVFALYGRVGSPVDIRVYNHGLAQPVLAYPLAQHIYHPGPIRTERHAWLDARVLTYTYPIVTFVYGCRLYLYAHLPGSGLRLGQLHLLQRQVFLYYPCFHIANLQHNDYQ